MIIGNVPPEVSRTRPIPDANVANEAPPIATLK
jgi:hypothetical protein